MLFQKNGFSYLKNIWFIIDFLSFIFIIMKHKLLSLFVVSINFKNDKSYKSNKKYLFSKNQKFTFIKFYFNKKHLGFNQFD